MGRIIDLVRAYQQAQDWDQREQVGLELQKAMLPWLRPITRWRQKPEFAEVVEQETWYRVFSSLHLFQIRSDTDDEFLGWCRTIARNTIREQARKEKRERAEAVDPVFLDGIPGPTPDPMATGAWLDLEYAKKLLQAAKPPCNNYLYYHYMVGCSYAEIADMFGLPSAGAARKQVERCRELAESLIKE